MKKFLLIALAVILAACSPTGSEFSQNQQKWQDANLSHYRFNLDMLCFCAFRDQMPLTIEVSNGEVVSITRADGTVVPETDPSYEYFAKYATIDRVFSELNAAANGGADEVKVTYDSTYGFPEQIEIDFVKDAIDDELTLTLSGLEQLQ